MHTPQTRGTAKRARSPSAHRISAAQQDLVSAHSAVVNDLLALVRQEIALVHGTGEQYMHLAQGCHRKVELLSLISSHWVVALSKQDRTCCRDQVSVLFLAGLAVLIC